MLPNRFSITQKAEERLKREKAVTGLSTNIASRLLFWRSIERGEELEVTQNIEPGKMHLEKTVWLGESQTATETILLNKYPDRTPDEHAILFALHVESGLSN
ncbi:DndE family protein [Halomonas sp. THAF12]|uniref:DndE family protein n=1 Tax=Halomonas sp. B23F22_10 TaxID=3459515 RepID=UPI00373DFFA2